MATTPHEYIAHKRAEGLDTAAIIARQSVVLHQEVQAWRVADTTAAAIQKSYQDQADEAQHRADAIKAERKASQEKLAEKQWLRRAVVRILYEEEGLFGPKAKSANLGGGVRIVTRKAGERIDVRDKQELAALTPNAKRDTWNESLAKSELIVSADDRDLAILDGDGPFIVARDETGMTIVDTKGQPVLLNPTTGEVIHGKLVPPSVAVWEPPTRTWRIEVDGVEFSLPEWREEVPMPTDDEAPEEDASV